MNRLSGLWWKYLRFIQIFDFSVGVDIRNDCLILVKIRKTVTGFKVKSYAILPTDNENFMDLLEPHLSDTSGFFLPECHVNIGFPLNLALTRRISIPLIREQEINAFLNRTSEVFLPLKLDFKKIICVSEIMSTTADSRKLLVFLIKKHDLESFSSLNRGEKGNIHTVVGLWPWLYLCHWRDTSFSGTFYAAENDSKYAIMINSGSISDYRKYPVKEQISASEMKITLLTDKIYYVETEGKESSPLIEALNSIIPGSMATDKRRFSSPYLNALTLSLATFYPSPDILESVDFPFPAGWKIQFYRYLIVKSVLFWGFLAVILYLFSIIISTVLNYYLSDQEEKYAGLKNLLAEKEKLSSANVTYHEQLAGYQSLLESGIRMAWYIYSVARVIPSESWLSQIEIRNSGKITLEVNLTGYVLSEEALSRLLKNLENLEFVQTAELKEVVLTEVSKEKLFKKMKEKKILKFRIDCYV
jgi:Tfp pilus assembly protein PilN